MMLQGKDTHKKRKESNKNRSKDMRLTKKPINHAQWAELKSTVNISIIHK